MQANNTKDDKIYKRKRKRHITNHTYKIIILTFLICVLIGVYNFNKPITGITYNENSSVDYKVFLKDNDFYENKYLEKDNQYVASLIKNIVAYFDYDLSLDKKDIDYTYSYRVEAEVDVREKNANNSLYKFKETLIEEKNGTKNSSTDLKIYEKIDIDYNQYNNLIKKFVSEYDLENTASTLNVKMHIKINDVWESSEAQTNGDYVISLVIPLTTKTVAIELDSDLLDYRDSQDKSQSSNNYFILALITILSALDIILVIELIKYMVKTKTAQDIYNMEVKKILNNFGPYIQKVNEGFDLNSYNVVWLDTFNDMLKIRDTIQEPILMIEDKGKNETYFVIPTKTNVVYAFALKESKLK